MDPYLRPSFVIPADNPDIRQLALDISAAAPTVDDRIKAITLWIKDHIEQEAVDVFTALDVLKQRRAECQGHAFLYAALARALGIPTRVVNGILYSPEYQGFLFHTWAESYADDGWIAIDPTFEQVPADATHIKLIEGERISDLLPLVQLIGKIRLRVVAVE